jgi:S1-C subfamily serine protease
MTDNHVVSGTYDRIEVTDLSGKKIEVEDHPSYSNSSNGVDLAILVVKHEADYHLSLTLGVTPEEGANVVVIGNPLGLTGTVSTGVVSSVLENGDLIQFTAPISSGSSGGPVLNEEGFVIGIVDWTYRQGETNAVQNLNFAHGVAVMRTAIASQSNTIHQ